MFVDLTLEDSESEEKIMASLAVQVKLDLCFFVWVYPDPRPSIGSSSTYIYFPGSSS
jgi:hypothetical protein